jgi:hypothetical protein
LDVGEREIAREHKKPRRHRIRDEKYMLMNKETMEMAKKSKKQKMK